MSVYEARISRDSGYDEPSYYALVVRIDADGSEHVVHGYKGRHFKTRAGAEKSTARYIAEHREAHANGRLMAAAPMLLAALQECCAVPNKNRPERVWDDARAAILAATTGEGLPPITQSDN